MSRDLQKRVEISPKINPARNESILADVQNYRAIMWKGRDNHRGSGVEAVSKATTCCLGNELSPKFTARDTCHVVWETGQVTMETGHVTRGVCLEEESICMAL